MKDKGKTRVVHCKVDPYDVYIGRPSKWGNPYKLWRESDRPDMLVAFRKYLRARIATGDLDPTELKGKTLGCWCAPRLCHGDVLADFAEGRDA
jgi:hypothetical protein